MNAFLALVDQQPAFSRAVIYLAASLAAANGLAAVFALVDVLCGPVRLRLTFRPVRRPERRSADIAPLFSGEPR